MELTHALPLKLLTWTAVVAAAVSMFATPALSQETHFRACLQADGDQCRLVADAVGISVSVADGDASISYFVPAQDGWKVDRRESVNKDMEAQVLDGKMTEEDAAYAFAELLSSHDLAYKIPANVDQLKSAVGFASSAALSAQDQVDVIASHLQLTTGVSAITADYLVMKLGLEILEPTTPETPTESMP